WVAECDPEVIGLSDVADDNLRRRATLNLLEKFRRHELTDTQLARDGFELIGFRYAEPEADLGMTLRERGDGCEDVLECAIAFISSWELSSMSDNLAELMLDTIVPMESRRAAGYALARIGTPAARSRIRPLIDDYLQDPELDLKGLALQCNWPVGLSVPELFA